MASVRSLATSILLVTSGCAFGISGPDPERPRTEVPKCDTGKGMVALDGLTGTLLGLGSLAAFGDDATGVGVLLAGASALYFAGAAHGNSAANSCQAAFEDYNIAIHQQPQPEVAESPAPRLAVKKPPKKKPVAEPAVEPTPQEQLDPQPPPEPTPPQYTTPHAPPEPTAPPYTTPRPVPAKAPPAPPAAPKDPDAEDWSSFWKELP